jgi:hypothetical protein
MLLLDCSDQERQRRLGQHADPERLAEGIRDGREYRQLGLPVLDTTGRTPGGGTTVRSENQDLLAERAVVLRAGKCARISPGRSWGARPAGQ